MDGSETRGGLIELIENEQVAMTVPPAEAASSNYAQIDDGWMKVA